VTSSPSSAQRGFSIVEALVAMALMGLAFGSALQSHVRLQAASDVVRQRGEALRWAEAESEILRGAVFRRGVQWGSAWGDLTSASSLGASTSADASPWPSGWQIDRQVQTHGPADVGPLKAIRLRVSWTDRFGKPHALWLDSLLAGQDPALADWPSRLSPLIQPWP
jgi:prepilin-type N-terminal cleavage/methylation domain-containing protein